MFEIVCPGGRPVEIGCAPARMPSVFMGESRLRLLSKATLRRAMILHILTALSPPKLPMLLLVAITVADLRAT